MPVSYGIQFGWGFTPTSEGVMKVPLEKVIGWRKWSEGILTNIRECAGEQVASGWDNPKLLDAIAVVKSAIDQYRAYEQKHSQTPASPVPPHA
jgi:hypothetical protein